MALSQFDNPIDTSLTKFLVKPLISMIFCVGSSVCALAQDAQPNNSNESWTATTQTSVENTSPSRTTESHARSGNRSVDKQTVEVLGPNGRYQPTSETDKETIHGKCHHDPYRGAHLQVGCEWTKESSSR